MTDFQNPELREIYERYYPYLFKVLYQSCRNMELSEDLTQESFIKIFKYYDSYSPDKGSFKSWIVTIARNVWREYLERKSKHDRNISTEEEQIEPSTSGESSRIEDKLLVEDVLRTIESFSEPERSILIYRYFEDKTLKEISSILKLPASSVYRKMLKAILVLQNKLKEKNIQFESD